MNLKILFEDNHLLVLNKDAGVVTQGSLENQVSLVDQVREYLIEKYQKPGNAYVGIVSRLDSLVTGTIVLAKTSKAASRLNQQFREHQTEKKYWAIVSGELPHSNGTLIDFVIKNDTRKQMEIVSESTRGAQRAELRFRTLAQFQNRSLIEVELLTGRKHQIRLQLSSRDCPILGDRKYQSQERFPKGIALHSRRLKLRHPTTKVSLEFVSELPDYWPKNVTRRIGLAEEPGS